MLEAAKHRGRAWQPKERGMAAASEPPNAPFRLIHRGGMYVALMAMMIDGT